MTNPPTVPPPHNGLGSNSNYILSSDCNPLINLSVTIDVTQDIVVQSSSGSLLGFGFQLNAYSPKNEKVAWQQYIIALLEASQKLPSGQADGILVAAVDNWPVSGDNIINDFFDLANTLAPHTLPKGWQLRISLTNGLWRTSWAQAVPGGWASAAGEGGLLLYDRAAGLGAFYAVTSRGLMTRLSQTSGWRTSWDLAASGGWGSAAGYVGLLLYDRAAGFGAFYSADSRGQLTLLSQNSGWRTSWDLAVTGNWAEAGAGLLLYDRAAGTGAFYAVSTHGGMTLLHQYTSFRRSWDLAVAGGWGAAGAGGLLLYDRAAGTGAFYSVDSHGGMTLLAQYDSWRTSWDLAVSGNWAGGGAGLLLYDRAAGFGAFYAIDSQGGMTLLSQASGWRTSWDIAASGGWAGSGAGGLLLYDRAAGTGAFYAVDSHGVMTLLQQYDDRIISATYTATDAQGKTRASATKELAAMAGVTPQELAPITALELNLVGPANSESAVLSSGAGTVTYAASTPLTVLRGEPACTETGTVTAETANTSYGVLAAGPSNSITQTFTFTTAKAIHATGKIRPGLVIPAGTVIPPAAT
jgi:hypothetical protein